jgi:hypothetical protein
MLVDGRGVGAATTVVDADARSPLGAEAMASWSTTDDDRVLFAGLLDTVVVQPHRPVRSAWSTVAMSSPRPEGSGWVARWSAP